MNKRLLAAVGGSMMLGAVAASAQGLPFSSGATTDQPWSVNRMPPRDANAYHPPADQSQADQSAARDRVATQK
ncbi:MAG TPA: hypothetical protein VGC09_06555 [Rhodopila sp.]